MKKSFTFVRKNLLYFITLFILSSIIATSVGMILSESNARRTIKNILLPTATITEDFNKIYKADQENQSVGILPPHLETIISIGDLGEVEYYDYSFPSYIEITNLNLVNLSKVEYVPPLIRLIGISKPQMSDLRIGKINLVEGRLPNEEEIENGDYVSLISKEFAELNGIKVGDSLTSNVLIRSKLDIENKVETTLNLKVTGLYDESIHQNSGERDKVSILRHRSDILNNFYVPNKVAKNIFIHQEELSLKNFPDDYVDLTDSDGNKMSGEQFLEKVKEDDYYEPVYLLNPNHDLVYFNAKASKLMEEYEYMKLLYNEDKFEYLVSDVSYLPVLFRILWIISFLLCVFLLFFLFFRINGIKLIIFVLLPILIAVYAGALFIGQKISTILPYEIIYPELRIDGEKRENLAEKLFDESQYELEKDHDHVGHDHADHEYSANIEEDWDEYAYKRIDPYMINLAQVTKAYQAKIDNTYLFYYFSSCAVSILLSSFLNMLVKRIFK